MKNRKRVSKILALVFIFVSLFSSTVTQFNASAEAVNVLRGDPTFESYEIGAVPRDVFDFAVDEIPYSIVEGGANGTSKAVMFEATGYQTLMQQAQPAGALKTNQDYKLTCWVKGKIYKIILELPNAEGTMTKTEFIEYPGGNGPVEWTKHEYTFKTPETWDIKSFSYILKFQAGGGTVHIDEVSIAEYDPSQEPEPTQEPADPTQTPIPQPTPILANGDFESVIEVPDSDPVAYRPTSATWGWGSWGAVPPLVTGDDAINGNYSLKVQGNCGMPHNHLYLTGNDWAGRTIKFSFKYKILASPQPAFTPAPDPATVVKNEALKIKLGINVSREEYIEGNNENGYGIWLDHEAVKDQELNKVYTAERVMTLPDFEKISELNEDPEKPNPTDNSSVSYTLAVWNEAAAESQSAFIVDDIMIEEVEATPEPSPTPVPEKPAKPKITTKVNDNIKKVKGTAVKGGTVTAYKGKNELGSATVKNNGKFTLALKAKQKVNTKITFKVELDGQTSDGTDVRVIPRPPKVNKVTAKSKRIKGSATPKAKITINGKGIKLNTKANKKGKFNLKLKKKVTKKLKKKLVLKVRSIVGKRKSVVVKVKVK